jgi:hypothetical protein
MRIKTFVFWREKVLVGRVVGTKHPKRLGVKE